MKWVAIFLVTAFLVSCASFDLDPREYRTDRGSGAYAFNAETIRGNVAIQGDTFTPSFRPPIAPISDTPVGWTPSDYERTIERFGRDVLKEGNSGWFLGSQEFQLLCKQVEAGLQRGYFGFFKTFSQGATQARLERTIDILPQNERLNYVEVEVRPDVNRLTAIRTADVRVGADRALAIAEMNGGAIERGGASNNCRISIVMLGWRGLVWEIRYGFTDAKTPDHVVRIDAVSGSVGR